MLQVACFLPRSGLHYVRYDMPLPASHLQCINGDKPRVFDEMAILRIPEKFNSLYNIHHGIHVAHTAVLCGNDAASVAIREAVGPDRYAAIVSGMGLNLMHCAALAGADDAAIGRLVRWGADVAARADGSRP